MKVRMTLERKHKHSVRYKDETGVPPTIYIPKKTLEELSEGYEVPEALIVTLEITPILKAEEK